MVQDVLYLKSEDQRKHYNIFSLPPIIRFIVESAVTIDSYCLFYGNMPRKHYKPLYNELTKFQTAVALKVCHERWGHTKRNTGSYLQQMVDSDGTT